MSNAHFNKVASQRYEVMSESEKAVLLEDMASEVELTKHDVARKVRKMFGQIQNMVGT